MKLANALPTIWKTKISRSRSEIPQKLEKGFLRKSLLRTFIRDISL